MSLATENLEHSSEPTAVSIASTNLPRTSMALMMQFWAGNCCREDNVTIDWTAADDANTYGVAGGYKGWCNLDKEDVYEKKMPIKQPQCDCKYDGQAGAICEFNTESFCINQCTDNGICQQGFCVVSPFISLSIIRMIAHAFLGFFQFNHFNHIGFRVFGV
jgi:hypothetical protein